MQVFFCYFCAILFLPDIMHCSPISSYWFTLFIYRPTQKITFHYSRMQCLCPCLFFLINVVNIDIIFIRWFTWKPLKLVIFILFPNKSSYSFSPKTITLFSLSAFKGVSFIVAWLWPPGTYPCILRLTSERPSHEVPASFMLLLGISLFYIITLIWGIVNFTLHYHQYFYQGNISWSLPIKVRVLPAPNFILEFSYLRKVASQG